MVKGIRLWSCLMLVFSLATVSACVSMHRTGRLMARHPDVAELGRKPPVCTSCHDRRSTNFTWEQFDHTAAFGENHKRPAYRHEEVCAMCHKSSFCSDCHGNRVELKPSLKNRDSTSMRTPHRGDYLARHRIDGRVDPVSCARCHKNAKTSEGCVRCHD